MRREGKEKEEGPRRQETRFYVGGHPSSVVYEKWDGVQRRRSLPSGNPKTLVHLAVRSSPDGGKFQIRWGFLVSIQDF